MAKRSKATVPVPDQTLPGLQAAVMGLKEIAEVLDGQRGNMLDAAVTWQDLVDLGIVKPANVPARGPTRL
ncbi:MAG TPA: hypothetical protein VMS92_02590 [Mycobacterium sp.]|nr:hypothetical protein [Mycobacterium sp.]